MALSAQRSLWMVLLHDTIQFKSLQKSFASMNMVCFLSVLENTHSATLCVSLCTVWLCKLVVPPECFPHRPRPATPSPPG